MLHIDWSVCTTALVDTHDVNVSSGHTSVIFMTEKNTVRSGKNLMRWLPPERRTRLDLVHLCACFSGAKDRPANPASPVSPRHQAACLCDDGVLGLFLPRPFQSKWWWFWK
jgi:hypothetical protein